MARTSAPAPNAGTITDLEAAVRQERAGRAAIHADELPPIPGLTITDHLVPGSDDDVKVRVRVYRPEGRPSPLPLAVYMHGGAFVLGSLDMVHQGVAQLALGTGAVIVSVGYRLAPEHPFPAGLNDCYSALRWASAHAEELGADPARIGLAGVSAGATLALGVALLTRDRGGPAVRFQSVVMPTTDDRLETPSMRDAVDTPVWNRPLAVQCWRLYLGEGVTEADQYAAPARADDLTGLPPTYLAVGGEDPLRDEGILFALRLMQAGVPVDLHAYAGAAHGFRDLDIDTARRAQEEQIWALRRGLAAD
ncbi:MULTISPECIES: alpha/beta hydrolase [unclassified Parafrankia]|uniref:alpha/beta hydrolase n=1 Tax=unclassified Parafrankia TaxID=2994368 RepID=UPI000DA58891|nr:MULTISPECIES: alpha/beta hydrolase [unclassified Parafrankia]TCJ32077.1 alpha/beta hydrolase [Parafrankia sp. BMG5.11]CAI7980948.1 Carboxylesterase NlhH [Frankia sp. Hr75.2]SQD99979.1 Alpha/beta hydrolase fold-3 domain protein [Parafrankia sp. Ea1.12]